MNSLKQEQNKVWFFGFPSDGFFCLNDPFCSRFQLQLILKERLPWGLVFASNVALPFSGGKLTSVTFKMKNGTSGRLLSYTGSPIFSESCQNPQKPNKTPEMKIY